ncbi:hypothetical protein [Flexithrix dorotheae]|uniref:hypothetical protein n=1 Tax=Flexithrix dorotheae TaxID=70993 RepID=UPI0012FCC0E7|nr:hypothetical protein [Flexithrix dorotheae]
MMKKKFAQKLTITLFIMPLLLFVINVSGQQLDNLKNQNPVKISGSFSMVNTFYHAWGIEDRRPPYYWLLNGNVNINLYGVDIPVSLSISQQQQQFVQPFNQYGVSPRYKSITLHAGHRSLNFSELTLGSNVFLGLGVEYTPSNLPIKVSSMRGRLIAPTPAGSFRNGIEIPPTYKRMGQGIKITGFRKSDQIDFTLFQANDDISSTPLDSGGTSANYPSPEENVVVELGLRKQLFKRLSLEIKFASSIYNLDSRSPAIESENLGNKLLSPLIKTNASTQHNKAIIGKLNYSKEKYNLYLNYRRIDPEYKSMGSVFLTNDLEDITTGFNFNLLKNKINLDLNGGVQYNNLNRDKLSRMERLIGGVNLSYNVNESINLAINYSNFNSSTVYSAFTTLDSLSYVQVTQNAGIVFNHALANTLKGNLFLQGNIQKLTDPTNRDSNFYNFSTGYQTKLNKLLSLNSAVNYTNNASGDLITNSVGPSLSIAAQKRKRFKTNLSVVWLYAYTDGKISNKYKTYSLNYNHPLGKHQRLSARISFLDRIRIAETASRVNELRAEINYGYNF